MKYVALLRGINVGGNNIIKMAALKECFEKNGYKKVLTFIQSGNVIFESENNQEKIVTDLEKVLSITFNYKSRIVLFNLLQMEKVSKSIPKDWINRDDLRQYIAFLKPPLTAKEALNGVEAKEGVDFITAGPGVLYMATLLSSLTKSSINKLIGKKIYQEMTIRNLNTTVRLIEIMSADS